MSVHEVNEVENEVVSEYDEGNRLVNMDGVEFEYDNDTGQYYYRARMYSPAQSRFISSDPMGMVDGPNMYAYVQNDPVNARDLQTRFKAI